MLAGRVCSSFTFFIHNPARDTRGLADAAYCTLEGGFTSIRAAGNVPSAITDPEGRVLASLGCFVFSRVMIADLLFHAEETVDRLFGDVSADLYSAGIVDRIVWALLSCKQPSRAHWN